MTKSEYFALPNSERYAAAQNILKGRICLRGYGQSISEAGFESFGKYLRQFNVNTYRIEYGYFMDCCFIEVDSIEVIPKGFEVVAGHEFESKKLLFEPTNLPHD